MNTGSILMGKPSLGSWVGYGLGTENQNLPAFVVLPDPGRRDQGRPAGLRRGVPAGEPPGDADARRDRSPILDLDAAGGDVDRRPAADARPDRPAQRPPPRNRAATTPSSPRGSRRMSWPSGCRSPRPRPSTSRARPAETQRLYGLDDPTTAEFGTRCLLARRLVERGVRFVQLYSGDVNGWDAHDDVEANHAAMCARTDQPVAGLLTDLKRRGLLDETLVIWGGEFGRMPMSESGRGRDHNPHGFTTWLAGAGIKGGTVHGATDAVGLRAEVDRGPRPRPARHDPPPAGPRPHPADLPPQRPRRPPDRHRRHGRPGDPGLSRRLDRVSALP